MPIEHLTAADGPDEAHEILRRDGSPYDAAEVGVHPLRDSR